MVRERRLAPSPSPDDDGRADPSTRRALAAAQGGNRDCYLQAVVALCADRVLVPVVATATRVAPALTGLASDKEAEMAVVLVQADDGPRALLAFTGMDSLQRWDDAARPVPVTLDLAARSALSEGATALVVDTAGPHPLTLEHALLTELAEGRRLVSLPDGTFGWAFLSGQ